MGCWENDGYVHVCLGMDGLLLATFWRLIYARAADQCVLFSDSNGEFNIPFVFTQTLTVHFNHFKAKGGH